MQQLGAQVGDSQIFASAARTTSILIHSLMSVGACRRYICTTANGRARRRSTTESRLVPQSDREVEILSVIDKPPGRERTAPEDALASFGKP